MAALSGKAAAASSYDDAVVVADGLALEMSNWSGTTCPRQDVSTSWSSMFLRDDFAFIDAVYDNNTSQNRDAIQQSYLNAVSNGSWGVSSVEVQQGGGYLSYYQIFWNASHQLNLVFDGYNLVVATNATHLVNVVNHRGFISGYDTCAPLVSRELSDDVVISTKSTSSYAAKVLFVANAQVTYPTGYEGELIPASPPPAKYVAMGDSFSSGEGNPTFEPGTDVDDVNECHRSEYAYPEWLSQTPSLGLSSYVSVACSGATTDNVLNGQWNEPAQVDALSIDTEVVTITIGGNNVGFGDFATACVTPTSECDYTTDIYSDTMTNILTNLSSDIEDVLVEIADRTSDAIVYVVGYPFMTPDTGLSSLPTQCNYLNSSVGDGADSLAAIDIVEALNEQIGDTVSGFTNLLSDTEFVFVDPNMSVDGTFSGHDLCQDLDSYFYNVSPNDVLGNGYRQKIFHPNVYGQYEYYTILSGVMD